MLMYKGASINHVRFEGVKRVNENLTFDHVGEEEVKQDTTYIFFTELFKLRFRRIHITRHVL